MNQQQEIRVPANLNFNSNSGVKQISGQNTPKHREAIQPFRSAKAQKNFDSTSSKGKFEKPKETRTTLLRHRLAREY